MKRNIPDFLSVLQLKEYEPNFENENLFGILDRGKGNSIFLNKTIPYSFVALLEFKQDLGPRGNHYHKNKKEELYVIQGKLIGYYWFKSNPQNFTAIHHEAGDWISIKSGLCHSFLAEDQALVLELATTPFNAQDSYYTENIFLSEHLQKMNDCSQ